MPNSSSIDGSTDTALKAREIGGRIALARKEAGGMKQRELAELLGVTERSIAAYESGQVVPYRFLRLLEDSLGRPAAWFLYGDEAIKVPYEDYYEELKGMFKQLQRNQEKILKILAEKLA